MVDFARAIHSKAIQVTSSLMLKAATLVHAADPSPVLDATAAAMASAITSSRLRVAVK